MIAPANISRISIPALENGDLLSRAEFERRYTATIDLRDKKRVYRRNQVKEYLVWQVIDRQIDWFVLQEEEYISLHIRVTGQKRFQPPIDGANNQPLI